jgi:2-keto-4-pentenoate hydratase
MASFDYHRAAQALLANRNVPGPMSELPQSIRPPDERTAYRVQHTLNEMMAREGWGPAIGYKIGCTTDVMQKFLGIDHPCAGALMTSATKTGAAAFHWREFHHVGVECEIAVRLGAELCAGADRTAARDAIDQCMAAIEIVDARYANYASFSTPTLIADDFFQARAVLSYPVPAATAMPLDALHGEMVIDGLSVGEGSGCDILGEPLDALVWLANSHAAREGELRQGDIVLLGSVVATQWLTPKVDGSPTLVEVHVEGIGSASAQFHS